MSNKSPRRWSAERQPETLRPQHAFAAYTLERGHPTAAPNGEAIAQAIARKHCAGHAGAITGRQILTALAQPPNPECPASQAASWMLATIRIHECALLVTHCGVHHEDLARHVRARPQQRNAIVRFLNQFALAKPTTTGQP